MTVSSLRTAIQEAKRFSELAKALLELRHTALGGDTEFLPTGKLSGAVKRKSMDLTRALSELRKP